MSDQPKSFEFQAEIKQLLDILIHSVYTSKDVFLRELISNATDALEKLRFRKVSGEKILEPDLDLRIQLESSEIGEQKVLTITDTGIGMTTEEVQQNIGTIAHSGATAFLNELKSAKKEDGENADAAAADKQPLDLIGQFGVGFYSVFMVAEKVVLTTRSYDAESAPTRWVSEGLGSYTLETPEERVHRGTEIKIFLKESEDRFANLENVKQSISRFSNFVPFPILIDGKQANQTTALWREPAFQIKDDQYNEFYKLISHDQEEPFSRLHYTVDVPFQFSSLLFIPTSNHEMIGFGEGEVSLQLYVQRVLIDANNQDLLPKYLRFVKGVIESEDLPLNVSRETLQENRMVSKIRDMLTSKLLDQFAQIAEKEPDRYEQFWKTFGKILKEGYSDFAHREKLHQLLRFNSSRHNDAESIIGLADYVKDMPEGQKAIYYLTGPSRAALLSDSRLELFRKRKVEVIYLTEVADEFVLSGVGTFQEKPLVSADQVNPDDLPGGDADKQQETTDAKTSVSCEKLIERFKTILGDRIIDVRASQRLVDSPVCIVGDDSQMSGHMDRMMRMMNQNMELPKRILEINPKHSLIKSLSDLVEKDTDHEFIKQACEQMFEGAMLMDGYLHDPHELVGRMNLVLEDAARFHTK